ncbi:MAG: hypothetical protein ACRDTR_00600 [Rubrobacter sp.]
MNVFLSSTRMGLRAAYATVLAQGLETQEEYALDIRKSAEDRWEGASSKPEVERTEAPALSNVLYSSRVRLYSLR